MVADRRIDGIAGRGGMGLVYRAWNVRLKRVEAVKVITESYARDAQFRERFERETEIAANIDHPHVVTIYDCGEGPDGELFIAMRYVEGTTMERLISERTQLDPQLAASLISQIASALDVAHEQGLVHRDIKPANVLIAGPEGHLHAYLTDFGLAKRVSSETMLTAAGLIVGTIDYLAPEQAQGGPVDQRADVYALGGTLFKALTGQVPFPKQSDVAKLMAKLHEPPPMASQVAASVPPALDPVLARALSQDPGDRYPSAGDLGRAAITAASTRSRSRMQSTIRAGIALGDCLLQEVVGQGGMGIVYRAQQLKLDRTVAVKVMSKELAQDPAFRTRFERECKIAASIDHPHVVPIHWAGEAQGRLYVVMALIVGGSLSDALHAKGKLEPERAVEVIEQLASALDAAHGRGLVHRDIKPGNVLIDERSGRVLLADFGLAKAIADEEIGEGEVLGSSRYMAPERGGPSSDEILGDIYSLGCVLWDLLAGTERPDLSGEPDVSPALAAVVAEAVNPDPKARQATAGQLARAARSALAAGPEAHRPHMKKREPSDLELERPIHDRRQPFAPEPLSKGVSQRVLSLCDQALGTVSEPEAREPVAIVRNGLVEPLRLAVVGGSAADRAALIDAVPVELLQPISLVEGSENTSEGGHRGDTHLADAFLVIASAATSADADVVRSTILGQLAGVKGSAVNRVCALTTRDPTVAAEAARQSKRALGPLIAAVRPVSVTLAVAANAGLINQHVVDDLTTLAALERLALAQQLSDEDSFLTAASPPAVGSRRDLLQLIGLDGVRAAVDLAAGDQLTVAGLTRRLRELSGIEQLVADIDGLQQRADALKAAHALTALEQLSFHEPALAFLRDRVESTRFAPQMHVIDLIRALDRVVEEDVELPGELRLRLEELVTGRSPSRRLGVDDHLPGPELVRAAHDQYRTWKAFENGSHASPAARRIAAVVARSLQLIADEVEHPEPAPSLASRTTV